MSHDLYRRRVSSPVRGLFAVLVLWLVGLASGQGLAATRSGGAAPAAMERSACIAVDPLAHHALVITPRLVGSAFTIAPGLAVTAAHVVDGVAPGTRVTLRRGPAGGPMTTARLLGRSPAMDLAVLELAEGFLRPVGCDHEAAVDERPALRRTILAAGDRLAASGSMPLGGAGIALPRRVDGLATGRSIDVPGLGPGFVAALPGTVPGFSGGPVVDERGRLVGMIIAIRRLPAAGRSDGAGHRVALSDEVYILSASALLAEAQRMVQRSGLTLASPR